VNEWAGKVTAGLMENNSRLSFMTNITHWLTRISRGPNAGIVYEATVTFLIKKIISY